MNYILHFDFVSVILCVLFMIFLTINSNLMGRTYRIILVTIVCVLFKTIFEIATVQAMSSSYFQNIELAIKLNNFRGFFDSLINPLICLYIISILGLWHIFKENMANVLTLISIALIPIILVIINFFFPVFFTIENGVFIEYPEFKITVFFSFVQIILTFSIIVRNVNEISLNVVIIFTIITLLNVLASLFERLNEPFLITSFVFLLSGYLLYIASQKPESLMNSMAGARKYSAYQFDVNRNFQLKKTMEVITFQITNYQSINKFLGTEKYHDFLRYISKTIDSIRNQYSIESSVYYLGEGIYSIIFETKSKADSIAFANHVDSILNTKVKIEYFDILIEPKICLISCPNDLDNAKSLLSLDEKFFSTLPVSDKVQVFNEIKDNLNIRIRSLLPQIIESSILKDNVIFYFQQIFDFKKEKYVALEVIPYIDDENFGFIGYDDAKFCSESYHSIQNIELYIIERICRLISSDFKYFKYEYYDLKLSLYSFNEYDYLMKIIAVMKKYSISLDKIHFGISEDILNLDSSIVKNNLMKFIALGGKVYIDDYGSGFNDVTTNLKRKVCEVKIDKNIFIGEDNQTQIIGEKTVEYLKIYDYKVTVKNVRTMKELDITKKIGFDCCEFDTRLNDENGGSILSKDKIISINRYDLLK